MSKDHPHLLTGHIPTDAEVPMIIVAGHMQVEPDGRASYLKGCRDVVRLARAADECLDFALSPDLLDPGRINVSERWQTLAAVEAFRGSRGERRESERRDGPLSRMH